MVDNNSWRKEYEAVYPFNQQYGIYIVTKLKKEGVIRVYDNVTEVLVPIEYDDIKILRKTAPYS